MPLHAATKDFSQGTLTLNLPRVPFNTASRLTTQNATHTTRCCNNVAVSDHPAPLIGIFGSLPTPKAKGCRGAVPLRPFFVPPASAAPPKTQVSRNWSWRRHILMTGTSKRIGRRICATSPPTPQPNRSNWCAGLRVRAYSLSRPAAAGRRHPCLVSAEQTVRQRCGAGQAPILRTAGDGDYHTNGTSQ